MYSRTRTYRLELVKEVAFPLVRHDCTTISEYEYCTGTVVSRTGGETQRVHSGIGLHTLRVVQVRCAVVEGH